MPNNDFLPQRGNYRGLVAYQKAECIYDLTYFFATKFLAVGDRTVDQMVQAARSGKQNIAEGSAASATSRETEIKLTNVAKPSLQELLVDYEDYLRVRRLQQWAQDDHRFLQARKACAEHNDPGYYTAAAAERSDETIANIAIILIHQTDYLLYKLIERLKEDFIKKGGIREEMTRARLEYRNQQRNQQGPKEH